MALLTLGLIIGIGSQIGPTLLAGSVEAQQEFLLWYFVGPFVALVPFTIGLMVFGRASASRGGRGRGGSRAPRR